MSDAFFALHHDLPRQGPGSDATTRLLLTLAGPLPDRPRALDIGCGPGRSALVLAEAGADVTAIDTHEPFLEQLRRTAAQRGLRVTAENRSMTDLPHPDASFDLIWAEGSAYLMGFDEALSTWRRLLAPGGVLVVTECGWTALDPAPRARAFWDAVHPLRTAAQTATAAMRAGYTVMATYLLPDRDWFDEYYGPLERRADAADPALPGMAEALAWTRQEIDLRRAHGTDYGYTGYVLRPRPPAWRPRPETPDDAAAVRAVHAAAFDTTAEADLVDALRRDPAWLPGLSWVAEAPDGEVVAHALLTRCTVGGAPALALAPVAVRPEWRNRGAGSAVLRAVLAEARARGEQLAVVLGHSAYYPRFGFRRAAEWGIGTSSAVADDALMALPLTGAGPVPSGAVRYPAPFGA